MQKHIRNTQVATKITATAEKPKLKKKSTKSPPCAFHVVEIFHLTFLSGGNLVLNLKKNCFKGNPAFHLYVILCLVITFYSAWCLPIHPSNPAKSVPYIYSFLKKSGFALRFKYVEVYECAAYPASLLLSRVPNCRGRGLNYSFQNISLPFSFYYDPNPHL